MSTVTLRGNTLRISGELPAVGSALPDFKLVDPKLQDVTLATYAGKWLVLNLFPSVDTGTCAMSVRTFNAKAAGLEGVAVLCISEDLPFAHRRFCGAEGIEGVAALSTLRDRGFGERMGLQLLDSGMAGLLARAVVVADPQGIVRYVQLVPEVTSEPDYDAALGAVGL